MTATILPFPASPHLPHPTIPPEFQEWTYDTALAVARKHLGADEETAKAIARDICLRIALMASAKGMEMLPAVPFHVSPT